MENNIVWNDISVNKEKRSEIKRQQSCIIWFTGLSGSGKTTLANQLEKELYKKNYHTYLLDGDNIRHGLNSDLGFDEESRKENIRRIGEVAKLFLDSGLIVLVAFISPFHEDRDEIRKSVNEGEFIEVFVDTSLEVCEKRDSKGLYKKARKGEIGNFTGISSPYEKPLNPELHINNSTQRVEDSVNQILKFLENNGYYR